MRYKLRSMIVVCSLAVLAISPASLACDKNNKVAAQGGSNQTVVAQVAAGASTCSKSRQVVKTQTVANASACATQRTMKTLAKAIYNTKGSCGDDCASRAAIVAAYRTMAGANPDFACKATLASLKGGKICGSAKPAAVVATVSGAKQCCADKARATKVANAAKSDPAACAAAKAKATKIAAGKSACSKAARATKIAAGKSACSKAAKASYVAFGCKKTDRVARAAAVAYLEIMRELQAYSGAKGCSLDTASKLLASILNDIQAESTATAAAIPSTETVANIETSPVVSFGAVSDAKKTCGASKN